MNNDIILKLEKELTTFLGRPDLHFRNQWLYSIGNDFRVEVYVRKNKRLIGDKQFTTLDIANIGVDPQGKGIGKRVIEFIHERNPYQITFIENVINRRFYNFLVKNSWIDVPRSQGMCLYKLTERGKKDT